MKAAMTRVEEGGRTDEWLHSSTTVTEHLHLLAGNQFDELTSHAVLVASFLENHSICTACFAEREGARGIVLAMGWR